MEISFTPIAKLQYVFAPSPQLRNDICGELEKLAGGIIDQEITSILFEGTKYPCIAVGRHSVVYKKIDEHEIRVVFINICERGEEHLHAERECLERKIIEMLSDMDFGGLKALVGLAENLKSSTDSRARQSITEADGFRLSTKSDEKDKILWKDILKQFTQSSE